MKDAADIDQLRTLSQEDLAIVYCARLGLEAEKQGAAVSSLAHERGIGLL